MYNKNRLKFFVVYLFYNYFLFLRIYRSVAEGKSRANSRKMVLIPESQLILTKNSIENSVGWFAGALLSDICPPKLSHRYIIGWGHIHRYIRTIHNFKVWIHRVGKVQNKEYKKNNNNKEATKHEINCVRSHVPTTFAPWHSD